MRVTTLAAHPPPYSNPVYPARAAERVRTDVLEKFRGSGGEVAEVKPREKLRIRAAVAISRIDARGISPVENLVHLNGCRGEPRVRLGPHLQAKSARERGGMSLITHFP
jgi:hypothetical protein